MIGIIGAMEEEVAEIKEYMDVSDSKTILDCTFYHGTIEWLMTQSKVKVIRQYYHKIRKTPVEV